MHTRWGRLIALRSFPVQNAAGVVFLLVLNSLSASATPISDRSFSTLAAQCAPAVPEWILRGVARTESNFQPWILHDNTVHISEVPASLVVAEADAANWIGEGHSVDLGLMQINSANLPALGMTASEALDPCASLAAGAAVLRAAYGGSPVGAGQQVALLEVLSVYNTGTPLKGIMNGYARTVMENTGAGAVPPASVTSTNFSTVPDMPPSWDVAAMGTYSQTHGAPWLVPLGLSRTDQPASMATEVGKSSQSRRSP